MLSPSLVHSTSWTWTSNLRTTFTCFPQTIAFVASPIQYGRQETVWISGREEEWENVSSGSCFRILGLFFNSLSTFQNFSSNHPNQTNVWSVLNGDFSRLPTCWFVGVSPSWVHLLSPLVLFSPLTWESSTMASAAAAGAYYYDHSQPTDY